MNRQLGTKWFTFYTQVRPILSCIVSLNLIIDFFEYTDVYTTYWWMLLYFIVGIALPVLSIIVQFKSDGNYVDFVRFVKGVLLFETIGMSYAASIKQYITNGFEIGNAAAMFVFVSVFGYFVWYRCNIKYFKKRILSESDTGTEFKTDITQEKHEYNQNNNISPEINKICFCRKCGNKLIAESSFCNKCGAKVISMEDNEYEM